jgi:hypothetical protein
MRAAPARSAPTARLRAACGPAGAAASSLLRLSSALQHRLPSGAALETWIGRAALARAA